jgi:hypothetical protein
LSPLRLFDSHLRPLRGFLPRAGWGLGSWGYAGEFGVNEQEFGRGETKFGRDFCEIGEGFGEIVVRSFGDSGFEGLCDVGEGYLLEFPLEFQVFGDSADVDAECARGDIPA